MTKVSVLILTRNEAAVIARCIQSASFADEIVVVDSESTDATRVIAAGLGAKVIVQPWLGWLGQKTVGLAACTNDWVFSLDADEIVTPRLAISVSRALANDPAPEDGFALERQDEFLGVLMPNMRRKSKRTSFVRLFNKTRSGWDPALIVHEEIRCPGRNIPLDGPLLHWRNYSIGRQLDTLNRNADLEAQMVLRKGKPSLWHLVGKPPLRFLWIYVACGYWRMGVRGLLAAVLHAFAEVLRHAKAWEAAHVRPSLHPPRDIYAPEPDLGAVPSKGGATG